MTNEMILKVKSDAIYRLIDAYSIALTNIDRSKDSYWVFRKQQTFRVNSAIINQRPVAGTLLESKVKIHLVHPNQEDDEEDQTHQGLHKTTPLFAVTLVTHTVVFSKNAQQRNVKICGCATRFFACCCR